MIEKVTHSENWRLEIMQEQHEEPWPDLPVPYSKNGRTFRPELIIVILPGEAIYVGGPVVKKDGTAGDRRASLPAYAEKPGWVHEIVEAARRRHNLGEGTVNRRTEWDENDD
jgi:hypothetical protein